MSFGANAKTFEMKEVGWDVNVEQAGYRDFVPRPQTSVVSPPRIGCALH